MQADLDYSPLRDALQKGEFEKADDITRANLIQLAGPDAQKRGWVYFSEVQFISAVDLQTMDTLWRAASNQRWASKVINHCPAGAVCLTRHGIEQRVQICWPLP